MTTLVFLLTTLAPRFIPAEEKPVVGYAPVNGLKVYYEVHGQGEPLVMLHGAFMAISGDWAEWVADLAKTRKVIAIELQGHGRTGDIDRPITGENLADDVAAVLDHIKIPQADVLGYSLGGGVALTCAVRHPEKVRKVVSISAVYRSDGWVKEGAEAIAKITPELFKGSPMEAEYRRLSPNPDGFAAFVTHLIASNGKGSTITAEQFKATKAPMFFIHGDADGVQLAHIAEMYRLKGGEVHGDMGPRSASRLAILPDTTHVTLMERKSAIVPMVNAFLDAKPKP
ncbi:MAG: alpha/beta hydrolase [Isosphaeraceae bacterium]